jgi:uncharacterized membrane-anchored protein
MLTVNRFCDGASIEVDRVGCDEVDAIAGWREAPDADARRCRVIWSAALSMPATGIR